MLADLVPEETLMQRQSMRALLALSAAVTIVGCQPPWYVGNDGIGRRPPTPRVPNDPRPDVPRSRDSLAALVPLESKVVRSKEEPTTLHAYDGKSCMVSEQRFREVIVGHRVRCGWR